jgi:arylsulfatase A-like enzyme
LRAAGRAVVALFLLLITAGHLVSTAREPADIVVDACFLLTAAAALAVLFKPSCPRWLVWATSPWVALPAMLLLVKLKGMSKNMVVVAGVIGVFLLGVLAVVWIGSRLQGLSRTLERRAFSLSVVGCGVLFAAVLATSLALDAEPPFPNFKARAAGLPHRPNVVLIVMDTVRADHLSLYSYKRRTTPNLEALASEAVLFRNAFSTSDITLSSHASMFTGLYPSWHGAHLTVESKDLGRLEPSFDTLAEVLSRDGYATLAVLANAAYLRTEFGLHQGFTYYDNRATVRGNGTRDEYYLRAVVRPILNLIVPATELDRPYRRADQITAEVLKVLKNMSGQKEPFFLSVNYMDAHEPYIPVPKYRDLFGGVPVSNDRLRQLRDQLALPGLSAEAKADLEHAIAEYDGGIACIDADIRKIVDGIKQAGVYDDTMIVVTSDHGDALGERGSLGHPFSVYQELVHVPLLIKYPRSANVTPGRQVDWPVSGVDLMPTVLDTVGIAIPENLQGQSLKAMDREPDRMILAESYLDEYLRKSRRRSDRGQRALFQGKWKFIGSTSGLKEQTELYDLSQDPGETHNLYNPADANSLRFRDEMKRRVDAVPHRRITQKMNQTTQERLRGLGYVK